jgi:succinate dehydrogenase hydrophobic anchor subunit
MNQSIKNEKLVATQHLALIFFIITGFLHLASSILLANNLFLEYSNAINRTLDLPFIVSGLIYGTSCLKISLTNPEKDQKTINLVLNITIIIITIAIFAINLLIPDLK